MILPDTSVWIDHARGEVRELDRLLAQNVVAEHPFVIGELLLGAVRSRGELAARIGTLIPATKVRDEDVLALIEAAPLHGSGIGYVDAHLLASALESKNCRLWTRDRRLASQAKRLGLAYT